MLLESADMYVRKAFALDGNLTLCPFLAELDTEETQAQAREESAIQEEMQRRIPEYEQGLNEADGILCGFPSGLLTTVVSFCMLPDSFAGLIASLALGIFGGTAIGVGVSKTADNKLSPEDIKTPRYALRRREVEGSLDINRLRMVRLDSKVNRIATKLLEPSLPENEKLQIGKAKFFFETIEAAWKAAVRNRVDVHVH